MELARQFETELTLPGLRDWIGLSSSPTRQDGFKLAPDWVKDCLRTARRTWDRTVVEQADSVVEQAVYTIGLDDWSTVE
jgi:hypothetical protein